MEIEIKIIKGKDVFDLLSNNSFVKQWDELVLQDSKVTVIQEYPFVLTWYYTYQSIFQPILALGFDNASNLVGIMPLAFLVEKQHITHAGDTQGEYHGWICKRDLNNLFPIQVLISLKKNFKIKNWQWRWTPPNSDINWVNSTLLKKEKIFVRVFKQDSPILDLKDDIKITILR